MCPAVGLDIFDKIVSIVSIKIQTPNRPFQKSWHHLPILGARKMTWSKFYTEDPQTCVRCFRLSACEMTNTFYVRGKNKIIYWKYQLSMFSCAGNQVHDLCIPILQAVYILQTCLQSRKQEKKNRELPGSLTTAKRLVQKSWSYN